MGKSRTLRARPSAVVGIDVQASRDGLLHAIADLNRNQKSANLAQAMLDAPNSLLKFRARNRHGLAVCRAPAVLLNCRGERKQRRRCSTASRWRQDVRQGLTALAPTVAQPVEKPAEQVVPADEQQRHGGHEGDEFADTRSGSKFALTTYPRGNARQSGDEHYLCGEAGLYPRKP